MAALLAQAAQWQQQYQNQAAARPALVPLVPTWLRP
jgi:hypothetical protein